MCLDFATSSITSVSLRIPPGCLEVATTLAFKILGTYFGNLRFAGFFWFSLTDMATLPSYKVNLVCVEVLRMIVFDTIIQ